MKFTGWLKDLIELFLNAFAGFFKEQGREEVRNEVKEETDAIHEKHDAIDARPPDPDGAIERLRARRRLQVPGGQRDEDGGEN